MDGASTDDTVALAEAYRQRNADARIDIVSEPDKGLYHAMNKALERARGQYVVFLNAGDALHAPDTLERIEKLTHMGAPAVIYGETDIVDSEGRFVAHRRLKAPTHLTWRSFRAGMLVCHQSFYARLDLVPPYDLRYRFSADVDWCIRVLKVADRAKLPTVNARRVLSDYLQDGLTTANHRASLRERFRILSRHYSLPVALAMHAWFAVRAILRPA